MKHFSAAVLSFAVLVVAGCGDSGPGGGQTVFSASGTVKMNGGALAGATVVFCPTGTEPTATGKTDDDGNFTLTTYDFGDGAAVGNYKVTVTKTLVDAASSGSGDDANHEQEADAATGHTKGASAPRNVVSPQFSKASSTTLKAEVKAEGENKFEFEVTG